MVYTGYFDCVGQRQVTLHLDFMFEKSYGTDHMYPSISDNGVSVLAGYNLLLVQSEVKVMFLKCKNQTITLFVANKNDRSYVSFEQISAILPIQV